MGLRREFFWRAIRTYFKIPLANKVERIVCQWTEADLAVDFTSLVGLPDASVNASEVLRKLSAGKVHPHSRGRPFTTHLIDVHDLLRAWKRPSVVALTGLCHSVYSTQQYPYGLRRYTERDSVRELVGDSVEKLVFLFCSHDRVHLYEQVLKLAKSGRKIPAEGLLLRNCLTGAEAVVPREVVCVLLFVHVADVIEQMEFFNFDFVFAMLSVADEAGNDICEVYDLLRSSGFEASKIKLEFDSNKGTFALFALASLSPEIREVKKVVRRFLDGSKVPTQRDIEIFSTLSLKHPYVIELKWLLLRYDFTLDADESDSLREEIRALYAVWGTTWAKRVFDKSPLLERMAMSGSRLNVRTE